MSPALASALRKVTTPTPDGPVRGYLTLAEATALAAELRRLIALGELTGRDAAVLLDRIEPQLAALGGGLH